MKMAALHRYIVNQTEDIHHLIIHTGQHYSPNMNQIFFEQMDLPDADFNLNINNMGHGKMTGQMVLRLEEKLLEIKPDFIILYGDTNSTLAGVLAASKIRMPIAHIEAGLRSFNRKMPEEINRIITDKLSDLLFCPSDKSKQNLINEGIPTKKIIVSGDIMQEAFFYYEKSRSGFVMSFKSPFPCSCTSCCSSCGPSRRSF